MNSNQKMFYGWWIVVGCFFLNFAGIGIILNCMGVFIKPVSESLGFTRGGFTLYFTIAALSMMVMAPVMGMETAWETGADPLCSSGIRIQVWEAARTPSSLL